MYIETFGAISVHVGNIFQVSWISHYYGMWSYFIDKCFPYFLWCLLNVMERNEGLFVSVVFLLVFLHINKNKLSLKNIYNLIVYISLVLNGR